MARVLEAYGQEVRSLRRRLALALVARRCLAATALILVLWGTAALAGRATGLFPRPPWLPSVILLFGAIISVSVHALRALPAWETLHAYLDARSRCGGLLLVDGAGEWESSLPPPARTRVTWQARRPAGVLLAALVYAGAALCVPLRAASPQRALEVRREADRLARDLKTLEEEKVLPEERARALEEKLEAVVQRSSGTDPVKTWEALDHLQDGLRSAAKAAGEDAAAAAQRLAAAEALAGGLAESGAELSERELATAMGDLSRRVAEALGEGQDVMPGKGGATITSEELRKLGARLGGERQGKLESLRRLHAQGLVDEKTLREAERAAGSGGDGDLAKYLAENAGGGKAGSEGVGGRGGVTRGRGDAQMTWQYPGADKDGAKFQPKALPPATLAALKESQRLAVSRTAPELSNDAGSRGGALEGAAAGGGSAARQRVLPRHRAAVKRYFER